MLHWLAHVTGVDTQNSPYYDFWSGIATQASIVAAAFSVWRRHNCHVRWCPRIQWAVDDHGHPVCRRHHSKKGRIDG